MGLPRDPCPEFPPRPGAGVDLEGTGCLALGETKLAALGYQPAGKRPFIDRLRVITEELDKGRDEPNFWLPLPRLPIVNRPGVHPKTCGCFLLGDGEHQPATADVFAQGLWLKLPCLLNQRLT
jgi:hypothetical protein